MEERLTLARERFTELTEECKQTLPGDWQEFFHVLDSFPVGGVSLVALCVAVCIDRLRGRG